MTAEERLQQRVDQIVADWPPLTAEQIARVSVLLWPDRQAPAHTQRRRAA